MTGKANRTGAKRFECDGRQDRAVTTESPRARFAGSPRPRGPVRRRIRAGPADVLDLFVYVVVLNLAIEYTPSVISERFTLSLLTAALLKIALEVVILLKSDGTCSRRPRPRPEGKKIGNAQIDRCGRQTPEESVGLLPSLVRDRHDDAHAGLRADSSCNAGDADQGALGVGEVADDKAVR